MLNKIRRLITPPPAMEQRTVELKGRPVSYTLKRTHRRRSIGLRIDDRGLTVNVPQRASEKWLHSVLQDKAQWVIEKLEGWQTKKIVLPQWQDGEAIPFMGDTLTLRVVASLFSAPLQLHGKQLLIYVTHTNQAEIEQAVTLWYQQQAEVLFKERVAYYAPLMKVAPKTVKLSSARTQWGSCTARGTVLLNWQLIKMPLQLIDYVVVHELAHLVEMNHSAAFWQVVEQVCPNYKKWRAELQRRGEATT
ncbi:MAG: SprT family zinc-dependent metalloprotease [Gallionellaceae bacterium]|nr:SprT family zinc-dependent metalloprotease [Gallionellaceae bacterium]